MPPLPPIGSVLKIEFKQDYEGVAVANILHYGYDGGPPTQANLNTFAATCASKWHTQIHQAQHNSLFLTEVVVTDLSSDTSAVGTAAPNTHGDLSELAIGANSAVVASFKVARRYRGGHPRMYFAGITVDQLLDPHHLDDDAYASWGDIADALLSDITSAGCPGTSGIHAVSVSYFHNKQPRENPIADDIIEVSVKRRLGSQRRRLGAA